ncbi:MAG: hypothetical protein ACXVCP_13400 [Bdellovibrio sp.]
MALLCAIIIDLDFGSAQTITTNPLNKKTVKTKPIDGKRKPKIKKNSKVDISNSSKTTLIHHETTLAYGDIAKVDRDSHKITNSLASSIKPKPQKSPFALAMTISKSREVETPENGQYSTNQTSFIIIPSYAITDNYSLGLKVIALHDADNSSNSMFKSGSLRLTKKAIDLNKYFGFSPTLAYGFPVNSKQNDDSFLASTGANAVFATKDNALGKLSLAVTLGYTKSFYRYKTELNLSPKGDDVYNSDYSAIELIEANYILIGNISFAFSLLNKQAWDYANEQKNSYDVTETLNWQITKTFNLFTGLENQEAVKVSESSLNYRLYNGETSTFVLGVDISI